MTGWAYGPPLIKCARPGCGHLESDHKPLCTHDCICHRFLSTASPGPTAPSPSPSAPAAASPSVLQVGRGPSGASTTSPVPVTDPPPTATRGNGAPWFRYILAALAGGFTVWVFVAILSDSDMQRVLSKALPGALSGVILGGLATFFWWVVGKFSKTK